MLRECLKSAVKFPGELRVFRPCMFFISQSNDFKYDLISKFGSYYKKEQEGTRLSSKNLLTVTFSVQRQVCNHRSLLANVLPALVTASKPRCILRGNLVASGSATSFPQGEPPVEDSAAKHHWSGALPKSSKTFTTSSCVFFVA